MSKVNRLTGRQIAAGRTLIGMSQIKLASAANVSVQTIRRMESFEGPSPGYVNNLAAIRTALEVGGVKFIAENGSGAGVRLRRGKITITASQIKVARDMLGWTQRELAVRSGVSAATITHFETGKRRPSAPLVAKILITLESAGVEFAANGRPTVGISPK